MGDIIELGFFMFIIAGIAFAPLGYFIYKYTMKNGEPFGNIEPHGDSHSAISDMVGKVFDKLLGAIKK